jgi:uncharacterized protein (TIGR03067 family)
MKTKLIAVITALTGTMLAFAAEKPGTDARAIQGVWVVISAELNGKAVESSKGDKFTFSGDKVTIQNAVKKSAPETFTLDEAASPKRIDIAGEQPSQGIYQLDGDKLKLCYGNTRPGGFDSNLGLLLVFKRQP